MARARQSLLMGAAWTLAARWTERVISLVSITLLARLLSPEQFGLVATAGLLVAIVNVFFSFGFDWVLVRIPKVTPHHYSTAWTLRVLSALACALVLTMAAWPAGDYFRSPEVPWVVLLMAGTILLGALENPALVEFRRAMDFRPEFIIRLASKVAGFLVAAAIAWKYRTFWALPIGVASASALSVYLSYRLHSFRPKWRLAEWHEILSFSIWILVVNLLELGRSRIADAFVARQLGPKSLGVMSLAQELSQLAVSEIAAPINRAVFSRYSSDNHDVSLLREGYLRASGLIWMVCIPVAFVLFANADLAVRVLFGAQWSEAAVITMILLVGNLFSIFAANAHYVFLAMGRPRFLAHLSVLSIVSSLTALLFLVPSHGLEGAAMSYVVGAAVSVPVLLSQLLTMLRISVLDFLRNVWRPVVASLVIPSVSLSLPDVTNPGAVAALSHLILNGTVATAAYAATVLLLWLAGGRPNGSERALLDIGGAMLRKTFTWIGVRART